LALLPSLLFAFHARAGDISDCDDDYSECKEDCTMQFGAKTDGKRKFGKCAVKCDKKLADCRERHMETKRNNLEEGSIAKSQSSRQSDEEDLRHADSNADKAAAAASSKEDDDEKPKKRSKKSPDDDAPPPSKVSDDEVVKSNRTKVSDTPPPPAKEDPPPKKKDEPVAKAQRDDPPPKKSDPPPPKNDPAPEPKSKSGLDSDVRSEDEKPSKKSDKPKDEGKKRKALDEWDPEAL
jgi:hypothetical protein